MNFFEQTIRKIFESGHTFKQIEFIGRTAYATIDNKVRLRLDLINITYGFDALKLTAFDKNQGIVDTITLRFEDVWGKKKIKNDAFPDGIIPHIYTNQQKIQCWHIYEPTEQDYKQLMTTINRYSSLYRQCHD